MAYMLITNLGYSKKSSTLLLLFVFILFEHHVSEFVKLTSFGL